MLSSLEPLVIGVLNRIHTTARTANAHAPVSLPTCVITTTTTTTPHLVAAATHHSGSGGRQLRTAQSRGQLRWVGGWV